MKFTASFRLGLTALACAAFGAGAAAQNYPNRPITFVVSFAPGGLSDVPGRLVAAEMQNRIGTSIVVENKPGGSGIAGATHVLNAPPDGYTILVNALADVQNLHYLPVPYDAVDDFAPIGLIADGPALVLIVNPNQPYKSVADVIAAAKANPGKVPLATSGPATTPAIAATQLGSIVGTPFIEVPYRGTAAAAAAVVTGDVHGAFVFFTNAKPLADEGRVRALAVASAQRLSSWPDLPTMAELGHSGFEHKGFTGLAAPKKTPAEVIAFLNKHLNEAVRAPAFRQRIEALGMTAPPEGNTPEWFAQYMREERAKQAELAKLSGHAARR